MIVDVTFVRRPRGVATASKQELAQTYFAHLRTSALRLRAISIKPARVCG